MMIEKTGKIVFLYNSAGYLYRFRLGLMLSMKNKGWQVIAAAPFDESAAKIEAEGIRFLALPINRKGKNPWTDFRMGMRLAKFYRREKPDIVHHFTIKPVIYGTAAARFSGIPGIVNLIPGLGHVFLRGGILQLWVEGMYRTVFSPRVQVIFQNRNDLEYFVKRKVVKQKQAHMIFGSGVDTEVFSPNRFPAVDAPSRITFSLVTRMLWEKGVAEFVEAAAIVKKRNPRAHFQLIGAPDTGNPASVSVAWLEEQQALDYIDWVGYIDDVRPYLAGSAAVVLPSYREGAPRALLEAASMGKPIVATDVPGCREVVDDGINGYLVPPKNAKKLAHAMLKLADDPAGRRQMGMAAREKAVKHFDERIIIRKTLEVYEQLGCI
jgi:glycosyltransferase involved in cell wall biosynthesis